MNYPLKRILFFLAAALLLAPPAHSVPLSSGVAGQDASYAAPGTTDADGETVKSDDGTATPEVRIVDHSQTAAMYSATGTAGSVSMGTGNHSTPGWLIPAGIGAGGVALFAVMSHHKHDAASAGLDTQSASGGGGMNIQSGGGHGQGNGNGNGQGGGGGLGTDNGGSGGGDNPPAVPEPGTLLMMGAGIASFLARKRIPA